MIMNWLLRTALGRVVTASLVALLLSGIGWAWHNFKDDLVDTGRQECVQEINQETIDQLEAALAAEKSARANLVANLIAAAAVNQQATERREALETQVSDLEAAMEEQRNVDPHYEEWSDTPLPDGVADRLRSAGSASDPSPL